MSTPITLTVGNITLTYNTGHIGIDHGVLFQERNRQRRRSAYIDYDYYNEYPEQSVTGRNQLMLKHRLRPDPQGNIEILDAFWPAPAKGAEPIAPVLLLCADLLASLDDRNREVAHMLQAQLDCPGPAV